MFVEAAVSNAFGLEPVNNQATVFARGRAFSRGHVGMFDLGNTDPDVNNNLPGRTDSGRVNIVRPTLAGARYLPCCLCLEDIPEDGEGRVLLAGVADLALLQSAAASKGARYIATGANTLLHAAAFSGERIIALVMETGTTSPTEVWFDGVNATWGVYFVG